MSVSAHLGNINIHPIVLEIAMHGIPCEDSHQPQIIN